jgi:hypothetical protein
MMTDPFDGLRTHSIEAGTNFQNLLLSPGLEIAELKAMLNYARLGCNKIKS